MFKYARIRFALRPAFLYHVTIQGDECDAAQIDVLSATDERRLDSFRVEYWDNSEKTCWNKMGQQLSPRISYVGDTSDGHAMRNLRPSSMNTEFLFALAAADATAHMICAGDTYEDFAALGGTIEMHEDEPNMTSGLQSAA